MLHESRSTSPLPDIIQTEATTMFTGLSWPRGSLNKLGHPSSASALSSLTITIIITISDHNSANNIIISASNVSIFRPLLTCFHFHHASTPHTRIEDPGPLAVMHAVVVHPEFAILSTQLEYSVEGTGRASCLCCRKEAWGVEGWNRAVDEDR